MSDGTNDRGAKPPRTLFSLGRPGAKAADEPAGAPDEPGDTTDVTGVADAEVTDDTFSGYLCGACEAPLPIGAVFCAECGTPVAGFDESEMGEPAASAAPGDDAGAAVPAEAEATEPAAATESVEAPVAEETFAEETFGEEFVEEGAYYDDGPVLDLTAPVAAGAAAAIVAGDGTEVVDATAADATAADATEADATAQPAAVLYADPSQAEPLPAKPEGTWGISEPAFGSSEGAFVTGDGGETVDAAAAGETTETTEHDGAAAWAAAPVAGAVAGAVAVDAAAAGATPVTGLTGTTAASMPYGHGPVESSEKKKSKTGVIVAAAAAAVLVLVIGGIALASGGKKDNGNVSASQTATTASKSSTPGNAGNSTTTKAGDTTSSTAATTTSTAAKTTTTATEATTTSSDAAPTSAATTPTFTVAPTIPPTPAPTPAPTLAPGRISPIPANGATVNIAKGGSTQIILQNVGALPASCTISVDKGNLSLNQNCSPSIPPGGSVTITVKANPGFEGAGQISGLMEGVGSYTLNIFVKNG